MVNVLFDLCGGKPKKMLYEATKQEYKAMIEIDKGKPLFTYSANSIKKCEFFDKKYILAPAELEPVIRKEFSSYEICFLPSGKNMSDTLRKCWIELRERYLASLKRQPEVHATFLCGDTLFIEAETIDSFASEAAKKKADIVFQAIDAEDLRNIVKKKTFIHLKNSTREITNTNLVQLNITKRQAIDTIENLLFRKESCGILDGYYSSASLSNFFVSYYKLAAKKVNFLKATFLFVGSISRYIRNGLEEDHIRKIAKILFEADLDYILTNKPLDVLDIDNPEDVEFARNLIVRAQ